MKPFVKIVVFFAALTLAAGIARSSAYGQTATLKVAAASESDPQPVQPSSPTPTNAPPPPPTEAPVPPSNDTQASTQEVAPTGQWVYTDQYGWIWMPYGDAYSYVPPSGDLPDMYVYYPTAGWCWVVAPWLWGFGPMPFFGIYGPWYFGWYGHGYGHWYGFENHHGYAGWNGRGYWQGGRWHGHNQVSPGYRMSSHGSYGMPHRSGYRAPATHSFGSPHSFSSPRSFSSSHGFATTSRGGFAGRGGFSGGGGFAGRGGFGGHGGHR